MNTRSRSHADMEGEEAPRSGNPSARQTPRLDAEHSQQSSTSSVEDRFLQFLSQQQQQHQEQMQQQQALMQQQHEQIRVLMDQLAAGQRPAQQKASQLPTFNGRAKETPVDEWASQIKAHYQCMGMEPDAMLESTKVTVEVGTALRGPALRFYAKLQVKEMPYKELLRLLTKEYRASDYDEKVYNRLWDSKPSGYADVADYCTRFRDGVELLETLPVETHQLYMFKRNLPAAILQELNTFNTSTLLEAMDRAKAVAQSRLTQELIAKRDKSQALGEGRHQRTNSERNQRYSKMPNSPNNERTGFTGGRTHNTGFAGGRTQNAQRPLDPRATQKEAPTAVQKFHFIQQANTSTVLNVTCGGRSVKALVDSGASFSAIREDLAHEVRLPIRHHGTQMSFILGFDKEVKHPKRTIETEIAVEQCPSYLGEFLLLESIPEDCQVLLGHDWLQRVNPIIDWPTGTIHSSSGLTKIQPPMEDHCQDVQYCFVVERAYGPDHGETANGLDQDKKIPDELQRFSDSPAFPLICEYRDIFRESLPTELPSRAPFETEIRLKDPTPITTSQFRLSPEQTRAVSIWVQEMLEAGIIQPSSSPFSSPTFCVRKHDGSWRIVHDYRRINSQLVIPQTPMPRKDVIFDKMAGAKLFTSVDLLWGFFQLPLSKSDSHVTAFSTPDGLFEYKVTPMGLASSPAAFNKLIQSIFGKLKEICAYFDDIFVFTRDWPGHLKKLRELFELCRKHQLYLKPKKCVFGASEIKCLGDIVGDFGVRLDPEKTRLIRQWPQPRNKQELQRFLGLVNYISKFIPKFSELVAPLQELLKGLSKKSAPVVFDPEHEQQFLKLKTALGSAPTLSFPNFSQPFHVSMDASNYAIGGYLFQVYDGREHILAYGGRKLNPAERRYPIREKELLAALHGFRIWRPYLLDKPFYVYTDHKTLETLLSQQTCSQRLARWIDELSEYQPQFKYVPGPTQVVADTLSRPPNGCNSAFVPLADLFPTKNHFYFIKESGLSIEDQCRNQYPADPFYAPLLASLPGQDKAITASSNKFTIQNGLIYVGGNRLCIPYQRDLFHQIMRMVHDGSTSGHPGVLRTLLAFNERFYMKKSSSRIKRYVQACQLCQRMKPRTEKDPGLLHSLEIPENRWTDISVDFVGPLPKSEGKDAIMVVVDRLTKRAHFIPSTTTASATDIAKLFQQQIFRLHGLPASVLSDRDSRFNSAFWQNLMASLGVASHMTTAFHQRANGLVERTIRSLKQYLSVYTNATSSDWAKFLSMAEFSYNSVSNSSIGMPPFVADLGYLPTAPIDLAIPATTPSTPELKFMEHQVLVRLLCINALLESQHKARSIFDSNRPSQVFNVGDKVLLSTRNLKDTHAGQKGPQKLMPKFIGPYVVKSKLEHDNYELSLPSGSRLHPIFHTSLLKEYLHDPTRMSKPPAMRDTDGAQLYQVESILKHRKRRKKTEFLVQWSGYDASHNSWEPQANLSHLPDLIRSYYDSLSGK